MRLAKAEAIFRFIILALIFTGLPCAQAAELAAGGKDTILIGRIQIQPSVLEMAQKKGYEVELKRVAESLEAQLINSIGTCGLFRLVERKRKGDLELEQAFAAVQADPNDKNSAQILKMTGAKFVFLPQIDGFEDIVETQEHQAINRVSRSRKLYLSVVAQAVDTTTSQMLGVIPSAQIEKNVEAEMARAGTAMSSEKALVELAKEMSAKLTQNIIFGLRPPKVLAVTGKQLLINRGTEAGFNSGDEIEIFASEDIKDEESGTTVKNEVLVGKAVISRSEPNKSFANISNEDLGITTGCIVRPVVKKVQVQEKAITPGSSEKPLKWE